MTLLYLTLLVTTLAMVALLALVFFTTKLRGLLKAHLYHRTFSFLALLAVAGMLLASVLSFTVTGKKPIPAIALTAGAGK